MIFAQDTPPSGLGAFNVNWKSFVFQLITFLIVLAVFKRWVLPPLVRTLEGRRQAVEQSLLQAKKTEETLAMAESKASQIISSAREQADASLAEANAQAKDVIAAAGNAAEAQAQRIVKDAEKRLAQEHQKLHDELKGELAEMVAVTTEKILRKKLDSSQDRRLIEASLKELV